MKKLLILMLLPLIISAQYIPHFSSFSYYTPKMDTLFLQLNDEGSKHLYNIWKTDTFIKEPAPKFIYHPNIAKLKAIRTKKDWVIK
jgi:hypothetical protein